MGVTLTGADELQTLLNGAIDRLPELMAAATLEALELVEVKAKAILDTEVYGKTRPNPADQPTYELYNSFVKSVMQTGLSSITGTESNTSEHAPYLEYGTDDEGTGQHWVAPVNALALHWVGAGGADFFSKGHYVKGITPIRFLERAVTDNKPEIIAIYRKYLEQLWAT